ncbi:hypothetical protein ABEB36_008574 [Hypothenemus hampei]|uniref:Uncharacterized protein n=1 Tax=Hypothenemus hampei TaxID=57062 RepID=A0ABD1EN02_HYPHA
MSELSPLIFLLKLAWNCRYRLPLLITVGFMVLDVRMQLDINVQMRQIPRTGPNPHNGELGFNDDDINGDNREDSDSSWTTFEEQETEESE